MLIEVEFKIKHLLIPCDMYIVLYKFRLLLDELYSLMECFKNIIIMAEFKLWLQIKLIQ
jgi:hypothetical protein